MKKYIYIIVCAVFLALAGAKIYSESQARSEIQRFSLETALSNAISGHVSGELASIEFADVFTFPWEKVYFFGPYTPSTKIDAVLNTIWLRSRFLSIGSSDRVTLIVFTSEGQVVEYLEYPRWPSDFADLEDYPKGFLRSEANFIIDEKGRAVWVADSK